MEFSKYFDPQVGEQVEIYQQEGRFEIVDRRANEHADPYWLDLKRTQDGWLLTNVPVYYLSYPVDVRVRRSLKEILSDSDLWPADFQPGRFDVKSDEMHDGTPRIMVNFYLKPEVTPSIEKAGEWREFYSGLKRQVEPLMDSQHWLQFAAKEQRSVLSAAS